MKNTPQECAKTSAFTFGACHFYLICFGSSRRMRPVYYCAIMMTFNLFAKMTTLQLLQIDNCNPKLCGSVPCCSIATSLHH